MKKSAGIIPFRRSLGRLEVFLVHPGGPYWKNKDEGAWSIAKGEFDDEDPETAARREFLEETGFRLDAELRRLDPVRQPSGKLVFAWAVQSDFDSGQVKSNTISIEWPPRSGRSMEIPEIDRAEWFPLPIARRKILRGQLPILDQLERLLREEGVPRA